MPEKQLRMTRRNLDGLPELELPDGCKLRTYQPGDEAAWAEIINTGIGSDWTAEKCREKLTSQPQFLSDGLFFLTSEGRPVGTACAWRKSADERHEGYVHMVCVLPEHRRKGLGHALTLAVLHYFRDHGFQEVVLDTDDWRVPAIKSYLRLGFKPHYYDDSHQQRWEAILERDAQG